MEYINPRMTALFIRIPRSYEFELGLGDAIKYAQRTCNPSTPWSNQRGNAVMEFYCFEDEVILATTDLEGYTASGGPQLGSSGWTWLL